MVTTQLKRGVRTGEGRIAKTFTIHPNVLSEIRNAAWERRKTLSRLVNDILAEWLAAQEEADSVGVKE